MWRTQDGCEELNSDQSDVPLLSLFTSIHTCVNLFVYIYMYQVYVRSTVVSMEDILKSLRAGVEDKEFLRLTRTALKLVQNVLNDPSHEKYRRIRASSKVR